ncbi:tRNA lysidine(34) synthetase TilS [Vibrio genomosp. F10]|uniref:tRNA lysidine(34) synthetase TilS n=1 Tax=Vibrio genomosp. F10 TaxID=723171 RepID=UPI0002D95D26|nr:tRNA lysidine(34) synthetase TilS [Vibrio genomosp. F10]OEF09155.1 tRNA lysidine(34) synthetase TilS [Vibrio genomosp. F10 str. 9ZB36]
MNLLYTLFTQVITQHKKPDSRLVLALSGGVDSRVLLELLMLYKTEYPDVICLAVHVHHGLSENADEWVSQCDRWCRDLDIPLAVEKVVLKKDSGESIEKLARDARYSALAKHIHRDDLLLTGQHRDDQVETFLLALKRGSGPKGLSSMAECLPFELGYQLRPLLTASRKEIEQFAHHQSLDWIEDESNLDTRFDRNFIRHSVTPPLLDRWPSFSQSVQRSAALCAEQETLLDELLQPALIKMVGDDNQVVLSTLSTYSVLAQKRLLRMWLERCGSLMPSRQHLEAILEQVIGAKSDANPQLNLLNGQIRRFNNGLYFIAEHSDVSQWTAPLSPNTTLLLPDGLGEITLRPHDSVRGNDTSVDACQTVSIRGDYIGSLSVIFDPQGLAAHPSSRGHSRKLKKLFQEYQVPSWLRRRTPIIMNDSHVVAVMGLFVTKPYQGHDCEVYWDKKLEFVQK